MKKKTDNPISGTSKHYVHKPSLARRIWQFMGVSISGISLAIICFFLLSHYIDSPKERKLKREKEEVLAQYLILNKEVEKLNKVLDNLENRDNNIYRVIFEADPIDSTIRKAGSGGQDRYEHLRTLADASTVIATTKKINQLAKALYIQSKSYDEIEKLARHKMEMIASIPAIIPISLSNKRVHLSSGFGYRIHPFYKTVKLHKGMDFSAPIGTDVHATGTGKVIKAGVEKGFGKCVKIDHGFTYTTVYAHLSSYNVKVGQKVKRGDIIGKVGNSGMSFGAHLHYEVHKNGVPVNPVNFYFNDLSPEEYDNLVEKANNTAQTMD